MKLISKISAIALAVAVVAPSAFAASTTGTLASKSHVAAMKKMAMKKGMKKGSMKGMKGMHKGSMKGMHKGSMKGMKGGMKGMKGGMKKM